MLDQRPSFSLSRIRALSQSLDTALEASLQVLQRPDFQMHPPTHPQKGRSQQAKLAPLSSTVSTHPPEAFLLLPQQGVSSPCPTPVLYPPNSSGCMLREPLNSTELVWNPQRSSLNAQLQKGYKFGSRGQTWIREAEEPSEAGWGASGLKPTIFP